MLERKGWPQIHAGGKYQDTSISISNGYSDPSAVGVVCWIWEGRGSGRAGRSVAKRVCVKERAVTGDECGGGEKGKMKLVWFVAKANWDGVKAEKCVMEY